jgi:hypothetical protein
VKERPSLAGNGEHVNVSRPPERGVIDERCSAIGFAYHRSDFTIII